MREDFKMEAQGLIDGIEGMRPRLEELGVEVPQFRLGMIKRSTIARITKCVMIIVLVVLWACIMFGPPEEIVAWLGGFTKVRPTVVFMIPAAILFIATLLIDPERPSKIRQIASRKDFEDLRELRDEYRQALSEHEQLMKELAPDLQKFERLRPVIVGELGGELTLLERLNAVSFEVCLSENGSIKEYQLDQYEDLVLKILRKREKKAKQLAKESAQKEKEREEKEERQRLVQAFESTLGPS